jgi:hypothetical protein
MTWPAQLPADLATKVSSPSREETPPSQQIEEEDGEAVASLLSILSLNANKRADMGGLHSLIRDCQSHLIFLQ